MDLRDKVDFSAKINLPDIFKKKFGACANCELAEQEITIFNNALYAVSKQLIQEGIKSSDIDKFTTIFTLKGEVNLYEQYDNAYGVRFNVAIYMMENIRSKKSNVFMLFTFIEEMAHY